MHEYQYGEQILIPTLISNVLSFVRTRTMNAGVKNLRVPISERTSSIDFNDVSLKRDLGKMTDVCSIGLHYREYEWVSGRLIA